MKTQYQILNQIRCDLHLNDFETREGMSLTQDPINSKQLYKMKLETGPTIITSFIGNRAKEYAYETEYGLEMKITGIPIANKKCLDFQSFVFTQKN